MLSFVGALTVRADMGLSSKDLGMDHKDGTFERIEQGQSQLLLVGRQSAPRDFFDLGKKVASKNIWNLRVNLGQFFDSLRSAGRPLPPWVSVLRSIDGIGRFEAGGRILHGLLQIRWGAASPMQLQPIQPAPWASPIRGFVPNAGHACTRRILRPLYDTIYGAYARPKDKAIADKIFTEGRAKLEKHLKCMDQNEGAKEVSAGIRRFLKAVKAQHEAITQTKPDPEVERFKRALGQ